MPSWVIKEKSAHIKIILDGLIIEGALQDCDGDFIAWSVKDNGNRIDGGELRRSATMTHDECWHEAKRLANVAIMTNRNFKPKEVPVHKPRVVKDFADIGAVDDSGPVKKKAPKRGGGREKGDRRADRGDKWADA
jgi:hypothetical protein